MISQLLAQWLKEPNGMSLFLSTFINKVDKKGRVSVPAPFRSALVEESFQGIVVFRSYRFDAIEACGLSRMGLLSERVDRLDLFSEDQDELTAAIFADAHQLSFDTDGRVMLPEVLTAHANIKDKVAFVGRGTTFQIWEPDYFKEHQEKARENILAKGATLKIRD